MASSDHLASSHFVKSVHQKLRDDSKLLGPKEAWKKHCEDEEALTKYAAAMKNLASNHWETNYKKNVKASSRVDWVYHFCQVYFLQGGIYNFRQRELEIGKKIKLEVPPLPLDVKIEKYKLLDVGSCYNPFKKFPMFDVVPIDIAPATSDVYKCDFLTVNLTLDTCDLKDSEITELGIESFDIVVFSLLLEYLPSPNQRLMCCKKAYDVLKNEGILFIISPDSKHVGANAKIMKSWRFVLAGLGLSRIKYEKMPYLHCMVFRKSIKSEIAQRWAFLQTEKPLYDGIFIPQDFKRVCEVEEVLLTTSSEVKCDVCMFEELPYCYFE